MNQQKKLEIKFKRSNHKIMSTWEIQDFIGKLICNYYKTDLLNEISYEINKGIDLSRIVIFNKSFDFKVRYGYLGKTDSIELESESGAKNFFHLGSVVGIFPSDKVIELNIKMEIFRKIYTYLNNKKIERLDKNIISYILQLPLVEAMDYLENQAKSIINKNFIEIKVREVYYKELKRIIDLELRYYQTFIENEVKVKSIKESIINENESEISESDVEIYNQFFLTFYNLLLKLERPVIGILSEDYKHMRILCKSYIHKKTRDASFLDLKNFSHNSPTIVEIAAGIIFALPLIPLVKVTIQSFLNEREEKELDEKEQKIVNKLEKIENELIRVKEDGKLDNIKDIDYKVVKQQFKGLNDEFLSKMNHNLSTYNFDNHNVEVNVIDFISYSKRRKENAKRDNQK